MPEKTRIDYEIEDWKLMSKLGPIAQKLADQVGLETTYFMPCGNCVACYYKDLRDDSWFFVYRWGAEFGFPFPGSAYAYEGTWKLRFN